eukprot:UN06942
MPRLRKLIFTMVKTCLIVFNRRLKQQPDSQLGVSTSLKNLALYDKKFEKLKETFNSVEKTMKKYKNRMSPIEYQNKYATMIYTLETNSTESLKNLRQNNVSIYLKQFVFYLNRFLKTQPLEKNKTLWRGIKIPPNLNDYTLHKLVIWKGFTSTSESKETAKVYAGKNGLLFKIHAPCVKNVKGYSEHPWENEYLLPAGTMFVVTKALSKVEGYNIIEMQVLNSDVLRS